MWTFKLPFVEKKELQTWHLKFFSAAKDQNLVQTRC